MYTLHTCLETTTGQTNAHRQGASPRECTSARAAAWRRRPDLAHRADRRENRICQTRAAADEEKHRSISRTSVQPIRKQGLSGGTKTPTERRGSVEHTCAHTHTHTHAHTNSRGQSRRVQTHVLFPAEAGGVSGCLWLVCVHICMCVFHTAQAARLVCICIYICVCVCVCKPPGRSGSLLTIRHRKQRQIRAWLVPSFLNSTKPNLIPEQTQRLRGEGGREEGRRVRPMECLSLGRMGLGWREEWKDWWRKKEGGTEEWIGREGINDMEVSRGGGGGWGGNDEVWREGGEN